MALLCAMFHGANAEECIDYADYRYWIGGVDLPSPVIGLDVEDSTPHLVHVALERLAPHDLGGMGTIDITLPHAPVLLDTLLVPGAPRAVAMAPGVAWIAAGTSGLIAIDVQSPQHLQLIGRFYTAGEAYDIAIRWPLAYVATWDAGLEIFDISDPEDPLRVGGTDIPGFAVAIDVSSSHAYLADLIGLSVVDIANPAAPSIVGSLTTSAKSSDIAVQGTRAYLAVLLDGVQVVDVSIPETPRLTGEMDLKDDFARSIETDEEHAYLIGRNIIVTSLNDQPEELGRIPLATERGGGALTVVGERVICGADYGLDVVELTSPPPVVGRVTGFYSESMAVDGKQACVISSSAFRVMDLSIPENPVLRGQLEFDFPLGLRHVATNHGVAYLGVEDFLSGYRLETVDVTDPDSPTMMSTLPFDYGVHDMELNGDHVLITGGAVGLTTIDVSDPEQPAVIDTLSPPWAFYQMTISNGLACVTAVGLNGLYDLLVIDVSNPGSPLIAGALELDDDRAPKAIAAGTSHVYLLESDIFEVTGLTLSVIDISSPENPIRMGSVSLPPGVARSVQVEGRTVYVAHTSGMFAIDVTNPSAPVVMGGHSAIIDPIGFGFSGKHVLVAAGPEFDVVPAQCQEPQAVELAAFGAVAEPGAIRISWRTSREEDHLGFHVERAMAEVGPFLRIHRHLIEPPGPYAHRDPDVRAGDTYYYRLAALDRFGGIEHFGPLAATAIAGDATAATAPATTLARSQPNPFTPATTHTSIRFTLAHPGPTTLRLYDPAGRLIQTLIDGPLSAGEHLAKWDGRNTRGEPAAAGTYFYKLTAGDFTATRALVRLR